MMAIKPVSSRQDWHISTAAASDIAAEHFNITATASSLYGELDQNFLLRSPGGEKHVLKVAPDSASLTHINCEASIFDQLARFDLPVRCPELIRTTSGAAHMVIKDSRGIEHPVRVLSYVEGGLLADVAAYDDELLFSVGRGVASVDAALSEFRHPAAKRYLRWDSKNVLDHADLLEHVQHPDKKELAGLCLHRLKSELLPHLPRYKPGVIHNDGGNQYNMLVSQNERKEITLSGIIDFGDVVETYPILGLGITCAYAGFGVADPMHAIGQVVRGYNEEIPVGDEDYEIVFWATQARLLTTVLIAAEKAAKTPEDEYAQISARQAWQSLELLSAINGESAAQKIQESLEK